MYDQKSEPSPYTPGQIASGELKRPPTIPMRVFLRRGASLCAVMLVLFFTACWKFTDGAFPVGIKRYALLGLICMFIAVRYSAGPAQITDRTQFAGRLSVLQMIIVIVGGSSSGFLLSWFFHS